MVYSINLNITQGGVPPRVNVSQYDNKQPVLQASLYYEGQPYTIPTGSKVYISGTKKDHTGFIYECTWSGNVVTAEITNQMTVFAGEVVTELLIYTGDERKGTQNFIIAVERAALAEDVPISETDIPIIEELPDDIAYIREEIAELDEKIQDISDEVEAAENAAQAAAGSASDAAGSASDASDSASAAANSAASADDFAEDAESWANGTRNGQAIPSTDPAYDKHAKHWADVAEDHADDAADSATAAAGSATQAAGKVADAEAWATGKRGGVPVPSTDDTYDNNSEFYAGEAHNSAQDAASILEQVREYASLIIPDLYLDPDDGVLYVENLTDKTVDFAFDPDEGTLYYKFVAA